MADRNDGGGGWGVLAGSGIVLTELFVLAPGLLPLALLTAVFAIPLVLPLMPVAIVYAIFAAIRRVWRAVG
jgi:hypothetical protein